MRWKYPLIVFAALFALPAHAGSITLSFSAGGETHTSALHVEDDDVSRIFEAQRDFAPLISRAQPDTRVKKPLLRPRTDQEVWNGMLDEMLETLKLRVERYEKNQRQSTPLNVTRERQ